MDSLKRLIGPAPSEMPIQDLLEKVAIQRDRVRRNLLWFQTHGAMNKPMARKKKALPKRQPKLSTLAKKAGVSSEDIAAVLAKLKEEKKSGN